MPMDIIGAELKVLKVISILFIIADFIVISLRINTNRIIDILKDTD